MNRAVATLAKRVALAAGPQVRLFSELGDLEGGFFSAVISLTKGGEYLQGNEIDCLPGNKGVRLF